MNVIDYVASLPHPKLSASIDGIWLEDEVPGFMTSYVQGRESYNINIDEITSKRIAGSRYSGRQVPSRDLDIHYYITTDTYEQFQQSFNKLRKLLWQKEEVRIIFGDEPNMFYVGTPTATTPSYLVDHHSAEGDITIHCCKPFKYSVEEHEINFDGNGVAAVDYAGTYPSHPTFEINSKSDLGYVAIVDDKEHVLQIGNPELADSSEYEASVQDFKSDFRDGTYSGWTLNEANLVNTSTTSTSGNSKLKKDTWVPIASVKMEDGGYTYYDVKLVSQNSSTRKTNVETRLRCVINYGHGWATYGYDFGGTNLTRVKNDTAYYQNGAFDGGKYEYILTTGSAEFTHDSNGKKKVTCDAWVWFLSRSNWHYSFKQFTYELPPFVSAEVKQEGTVGKRVYDETDEPIEEGSDVDKYNYRSGIGCTDYKTGTSWHGASISRVPTRIKTNGTFAAQIVFGGTYNCAGGLGIFLTNGSGTSKRNIAALWFENTTAANSITALKVYVNGVLKETVASVGYGYSGYIELSKFGKEIKAHVPCFYTEYASEKIKVHKTDFVYTDDSLENLTIDEVSIFFGAYSNIGVYQHTFACEASYTIHNTDKWEDVPNKMASGDKVELIGDGATIIFNGGRKDSMGALGNDWETMVLQPGANLFKSAWSSWATANPEIKLKYRDVYI